MSREHLKGKRILVMGACGSSGRAATLLYATLGAQVIVSDGNARQSIDELFLNHEGALYKEMLIDVRPREDADLLDEYLPDLVVISPGISLTHPIALRAVQMGIPVRGENDYAYQLMCEIYDAPPLTVAVTGTDGKSTTTALIAHLWSESCGGDAFACGNFGTPLSALVLNPKVKEGALLVVECSSFQLERVDVFHPSIAVILNIAEDHLDRYHNIDAYLNAKFQILNCMSHDDLLLAPSDLLKKAERYIHEHHLEDVRFHPVENPLFLREQAVQDTVAPSSFIHPLATPITSQIQEEDTSAAIGREWILYASLPLMQRNRFRLSGDHNLWNLNFALAVLYDLSVRNGIDLDRSKLMSGIESFKGLPHRLEKVAIYNDILFVNDSKSTTVQSLLTAAGAYPDKEIMLLCGGRAKGATFIPLSDFVHNERSKVTLFPFGESASLICTESGASEKYADIKEALHAALRRIEELRLDNDTESNTEKKDFPSLLKEDYRYVVLLSPGCASYDQFRSYLHRGEVFRELVQQCIS